MAQIPKYFTSLLALLVRAEVCLIGVFSLCVIALCAGRWPGPLEGLAILTVDTSSFTNNTLTGTATVKDWYDAHYLSICSGMWNHHIASAGQNQSTAVCWLQSIGYTFSIAKVIDGDDAQQLLLDQASTLNTKAPFILLVLSIVSMGLTILGFLYGIIVMARYSTKGHITERDLPLIVLRIAFFACIASTILLTISTAKITASSDKRTGSHEVATGKTIHVSTNSGFLAIIWVGTAVVWVALGLVLAAAFRLADVLQRSQGTKAVEATGRYDQI